MFDLANITVLSVDIFDTLLFRLAEEPKNIFNIVGKRSQKNGCLNQGITPEEFALLRIRAEQEARKHQAAINGNREISLSEIYEFLPTTIGNKTQIEELEIKVECEFCYLNSEILNFIEEAHSRKLSVVLTSDMYLSKSQLIKILKSNKFNSNFIDEIYVSCEHQCNKVSGKLFQKLISDFPNIKTQHILHIGDKLDADVEAPKSLGIEAYHYSVIPNVMKKTYDYEKICQATPQNLNSLRKLAVHTSGDANLIENQIGAGILGPVLTSFCEWILDICEAEGKYSVYPFMREAEMFAPMLKNAAQKRKLRLNIIPLHVSRESTWLASLDEWNREECANLLEKYGFTVLDIFRTIDLNPPTNIERRFHEAKVKELPTEIRNLLREHLLSKQVTTEINEKIDHRCDLLIDYLKQDKNYLNNSITVDLGFRGTINHNLEKALAKSGIESNITHLLAFGADSIITLKSENIDIRSFLASPGENQDHRRIVHRSLMPLEQTILGQSGSVRGYEYSNGKILEKHHKIRVYHHELLTKQVIHDAVLHYQNLWYSLHSTKKSILRKALVSKSERRKLCGIIHRMIDTPTLDEAQLLGDLHHDVNGGSDQLRKICNDKDDRVLSKVGSEERFLKVGRMHGVHWPQGVVTRSNPYFLLKRKLAQNNSDSYLQSMNDLVEIIKAKGFSKIIIYGAGEAGKALYKAAEINEIKVGCFVDRKESLWGEYVESAQVFSLETALDEFDKIPFVIGSFEFLDQIENSIRSKAKELKLDPLIFSTRDL